MSNVEKVTFNNSTSRAFSKTVKKRVNEYFEENNLSKHANLQMVVKTIVLLTLYFGSYALIMSGQLSLGAMWGLTFLMGVGMAGIGFSVSHDALHGAYSSNKYINRALGFTFDLLGANGYIWKITHNIIHHTYTNIHGHDEDLEVAEFIRLSPHSEFKTIHRIQHILAFFAYSLATFFWVFIKDYKYFLQDDIGPYKNKTHPTSEWVILFVTKAIYYTYMLALPMLFLDITWIHLLIGFTTLHITAGLILGIIFQLAHVVEGTDHPVPDEENMIDEHWMIHEMVTTNNFGRDNKALCWFVGGLNFQIEHHLFPRICSVHYPAISHIVEKTAKEHDIPYNHHDTFFGAVASHYRTLKKFGDPDYSYSEARA
ncbi:fatty acid desaturase [Aliifodinibius salicampi]|uniref:Fatty acid desaturase n=1 Tax=Fodinibius salicampi TaxID=1920655 RepID=A0ABT3PYD5_9BACT|nr:fatty acid desaturase [Fodinibius salicampi]MCW9712877.1 fatty acid desaturase [Fodinibius salicampi]